MKLFIIGFIQDQSNPRTLNACDFLHIPKPRRPPTVRAASPPITPLECVVHCAKPEDFGDIDVNGVPGGALSQIPAGGEGSCSRLRFARERHFRSEICQIGHNKIFIATGRLGAWGTVHSTLATGGGTRQWLRIRFRQGMAQQPDPSPSTHQQRPPAIACQ